MNSSVPLVSAEIGDCHTENVNMQPQYEQEGVCTDFLLLCNQLLHGGLQPHSLVKIELTCSLSINVDSLISLLLFLRKAAPLLVFCGHGQASP